MRWAIVISSVLLSVFAVAQQKQAGTAGQQKQVQFTMSKDEMIAKRKELQDAISETERQLEDLKKDKKATMGELRALQDKLAERQKLIENINDEMADIDNNIRSSSKEVVSLKGRLDQLKIRYAQSLRYDYETRSSYGMLAFLFSSRDFNDAMLRMKYLKKFRDYRKQQVDQIRATQDELQHKISSLNTEKKKKDDLLNSQVQQKQVLQKETNETNQVMEQLKGQESQLMKSIEKNREVEKRVDRYINMVIQNEIAKAAKEAEEKRKQEEAAEKKRQAELAKANAAKTGAEHPAAAVSAPAPEKERPEPPPLLSTPTDIALANSFEGNKGKMYWPVEKGYISDHFGVHPHPLAPQVMIENTGIDIQTTPDAPVRAVFEGTVSRVSTVENMMVLIKHGDYLTVYNNLKSVSVVAGQHVSTNQVIGIVANDDQGEPTLKFQIWKMGKKAIKLNPEQWLGRLH